MRALLLVAVLVGAGGVSRAVDHPEMRAALQEIEAARRHLEAARHDYRGHRPAALDELRQAADAVRQGIDAAGAERREPEGDR
jgi:hypothetical protein